MWEWLLYHLPWQVLLIAGVVVAGALLSWLQFFVGWKRALEIASVALAAIGTLALLSRAGQRGYQARAAEENAAQNAAQQDYEDLQKEVTGKTVSQLDKDNKPWLRP